MAQVPQLVYALKGTAPARTSVIDAVQTAEVKAAVIAALQGFRFGDAPFHQGITISILVLAPLRFVSGDTDEMLRLLFIFQPVDFLRQQVGFQLAGTPAHPDTGPAVTVGRDAQPRPVL